MAKEKKKSKRALSGKVMAVVLTVFSVFVAVNLIWQLNTYAQLKVDKEKLEAEIAEENKKKQEYTNQMEQYTTDEYIEKIAREQLGLVMPDEIVFKINN